MHILDIVQNSISAGASLVEISITESPKEDLISICVRDNGCGMSEEFLARVTDPFTTTRTTRKVGLGLPLLKAAATACGGSFSIHSKEGVGTVVEASFGLRNIDREPVGDMAGTMANLISVNDGVEFLYTHRTDSGTFCFDTRQIRQVLGDVPLSDYQVVKWVNEYIVEGLDEIKGEIYEQRGV